MTDTFNLIFDIFFIGYMLISLKSLVVLSKKIDELEDKINIINNKINKLI